MAHALLSKAICAAVVVGVAELNRVMVAVEMSDGDVIEVPKVPVVPILSALAALMPPLVLIAPVVLLVASNVEGKNEDAEAPVPPIVINVVAPANAVKEVDGVVTEVVKSGDVKDWIPVNVCALFINAKVPAAPAISGIVSVLAPVVCAAVVTVTVWAVASAGRNLSAPEVLPLI